MLLAACDRSRSSVASNAVLELYDTSPAGDPGRLQCKFSLPNKLNGRSSVEVYSGDSYHYNHSTFYTRPEDRILTVFVEENQAPYQYQYPSHITLIVVFVSTLLRLSETRRVVAWEDWKRYAWVADHQEADDLFNYGAFISSSRIIHFSVPVEQRRVMTLEVTTFRPSITERPFYASDGAPDGPNDAEPCGLVGTKARLDVQVEDDDDTEVMMTEDNIILMTVRIPVRCRSSDADFMVCSRVENLTWVLK